MLSLMIRSSAEDVQLYLLSYNHGEEVKLKSDVLLDNVRTVVKQAKVGDLLYVAYHEMKSFSFLNILYRHYSLKFICTMIKQMLHVSATEKGT